MSDYSFTFKPKCEGDVVAILTFYFLFLFNFTYLMIVKFGVHVNNSGPLCMFSLLIPQEKICVDLLCKNSKQLRYTMFVSPEI